MSYHCGGGGGGGCGGGRPQHDCELKKAERQASNGGVAVAKRKDFEALVPLEPCLERTSF
jgi:hypothetical protein